jgi:hypothetical protein
MLSLPVIICACASVTNASNLHILCFSQAVSDSMHSIADFLLAALLSVVFGMVLCYI